MAEFDLKIYNKFKMLIELKNKYILKSQKFLGILLLFTFCLISNVLISGNETRSSRLYANQVVNGSFIQSQDDKFDASNPSWVSGFVNIENKGIVEFGLNEELHVVNGLFKACVKFDVAVTDASLTTTTYANQQLDIFYNPYQQTRYNDKNQLVFPNAYKIKVYNIVFYTCPSYSTSSCATCTTVTYKPDLYLQAEIKTDRIYSFGYSSSLVSGGLTHTLLTASQELAVNWDFVSGAESYELEYTFVDNYNSSFANSSTTYDFKFDATRVVTTANSYSIPLIYEKGYIVYRLRPIGTNTALERVEGSWYGASETGNASSSSFAFLLSTPFMSDDMNWAGTKTFAENGKEGVGVNFTDGLGYNRQSLARLNTEDKAIAQSTLYDYYGRPTITMLPAPVSGLSLDYRSGLNMYKSSPTASAVYFDKSIFGTCSENNSICSALGFTLDPVSSIGSPNYYSPFNSNKSGYQGYLPNANGLPYTQIKYKPDALSRISHQSMPGLTHSLGSGREVRYYYAQPTQVELDRLFGSEAGRSKYHFKNISRDPNGQLSATYIDKYGKTIATSLIGLNPLNVDALANIQGTLALTEYLDVEPTNDPDPINRCKEVNTSYFVSSPLNEKYLYHTTVGSFAAECMNGNCFECVYDLEISIKSECGDEVFDYDNNSNTPPGYINLIGKQPPYTSIECAEATTTLIAGVNYTTPISISFSTAGVYTIHKKLCVSNAPLQDYTDEFISNNCYDNMCNLVDSILAMTDFSGCNSSQSCEDCYASISNYTSSAASSSVSTKSGGDPYDPGTGVVVYPYNVTVQTPSLTPQQLSQMLENCDDMCIPTSHCGKYTKTLLADFYPGGQYAETISTNTLTWAYSIFNGSNNLTGSPTWSTPPSPTNSYSNAAGAQDYVQINNVNKDPEDLTMSEFIQYYKKSWAKSFLHKHPEYCKLFFHCNILGSSKDYDDAMYNVPHYDTACASGYLYPIAYTFTSSYQPSLCVTTNTDPIISLIASYPSFSTAINSFTTEITQNFYGTGWDIYHFTVAQSNTLVANSYTYTGDKLGIDPCLSDIQWQNFKGFYRAKKEALYEVLYSLYMANPSNFGFSGTCTSVPAGFTSHFPNWQDTLTAYSIPSYTIAMNTPTLSNSTSVSTYTSAMSSYTSSIMTSMNNTLTSQCTQSCDSYTVNWHSTLNTSCPAYSSATGTLQAAIIAGLKGVCLKGCDYNSNLLGASSTAPGTSHTLASTSTTVGNFQDVLNYYLGANACNALVLSLPAPYPPTNNSVTALTSCKCDQILKTDYDFTAMYTNSTLPVGVNSAWQLFRKLNGYDLLEFNLLKCVCSSAANYTWSPGHTWTSPQLTAIANNTITVDPKLECTSCMVCTDVVSAINSLTTQLLSSVSYTSILDAITLDSTNHVLAENYLNNSFGPHPFQDYIDLYNDCLTFTATNTFSNTITSESLELFHYLNQLVEGKLLTKTNRLAKICTDSKYFLSSLYTSTLNLPSVENYTYQSVASGSVITFSLVTSVPSNVLVVNLKFPSSYTGNWNSLKYLNNFKAYCPVPAAGPNYTFVVNAVDQAYAVITLTGSIVNQVVPVCNLSSSESPVPILCPAKPKKINSCANTLINNALTQAAILNNQYLQNAVAIFQTNYLDHCYNTIDETFTREYNGADEYQFTLYYYDQAGNLQRTVPPKGVTTLTITAPLAVSSTSFPLHSNANGVDQKYVNDYRFISFNTPMSENTIDGGETKFIYDEGGRVIMSQNQKQLAASTSTRNIYSYTVYDDLGRISEVGELTYSTAISTSSANTSWMFYNTYLSSVIQGAGTFSQVTKTFYDEYPGVVSPEANTYFAQTENGLKNLRNRVSCVVFADNPGTSTLAYDFATYYSYDDHGNVDKLHYENNLLPPGVYGTSPGYTMKFKKVKYTYDLISGNMLVASYQPGLIDQFIHKYYYDEDNRLHEVFTSKDNINWDRDAKYFYYEHGPLARIERADKQVQGMDYFYTIHGWIKGINSDGLTINNDAGKDGAFTNAYLSTYNKLHGYFAKDAMAFSLNYYNAGADKDYLSIKNNLYNANDENPIASITNLYDNTQSLYLDNNGAGDGPSLYNGNISSMVTGFIDKDPLNQFADNKPFPQLTAYRYDQLHRVRAMKSYRSIANNTWKDLPSGNYDDSYKMNLSYDPNGNITSLFRNGASTNIISGSNLSMDDLSYTYFEGSFTSNSYNSNKLACVQDAISAANYGTDVDTYSSCSISNSRYTYDDIGNLLSDKGECIDEIIWTVDRKVKHVKRSSSLLSSQGKTLPDVEYQYNGMRQRVVKIVKPRNATTKALETSDKWLYTYYVYDASGNVMAVYSQNTYSIGGGYMQKITLDENHVYGSNRLAIARPSNTLATWMGSFAVNSNTSVVYSTPAVPVTTGTFNARRLLGYKEFELNNHLGNVIATVSDRKIIIGYCTPNYLINFNTGTLTAPFATIDGTATVTNSLLVVSTSSNTTSKTSAIFTLTPATNYEVSFDVDLTTMTTSDTLKLVLYPYSNAFGSHSGDSIVYTLNQSTNYKINYSVPGGSAYSDLDFTLKAKITNTSSSTAYYLDNITFNPLPDELEINPCALVTPTIQVYFPDLLMHTDYYAFGMEMPGRFWSGGDYRYGFNGKELDQETTTGGGGTYDYGFRIYNPGLGRFLSVDPLFKSFPWYTPYQFAGNRPIVAIDLDGLEEYYTQNGELIGKYGTSCEMRIVDQKYIKLAQSLINEPNQPSSEAINAELYNKGTTGLFNTPVEAAENWGQRYNAISIIENVEYTSDIYPVNINGEEKWTYPTADKCTEFGSGNTNEDYRNGKAPENIIEERGAENIPNIHSHGGYTRESQKFSPRDKQTAGETGKDMYLTTPDGSLKVYETSGPEGKTKTLSRNLPSDPKSGELRKNNIEPTRPTPKIPEDE